MRKQVFGRKLQRDTNERKALFKSLMTALIEKESIKTTEAKAKAVKGQMEKLVTKARDGGAEAERALQAYFAHPVMKKLVTDIAPRFAGRPGGYTRIVKIGNRLRDNAKMVVLEWVEKPSEKAKVQSQLRSNRSQKSEKKDTVESTMKVAKEAKTTKAKKSSATKEKKK